MHGRLQTGSGHGGLGTLDDRASLKYGTTH